MDPSVLARKPLTELKGIAAELNMRGYQRLRKADLIDAIVKTANEQGEPAGWSSGSGEAGEGAATSSRAATRDDEQQPARREGDGDADRSGANGQSREGAARTRVRTRSRSVPADDEGQQDGGGRDDDPSGASADRPGQGKQESDDRGGAGGEQEQDAGSPGREERSRDGGQAREDGRGGQDGQAGQDSQAGQDNQGGQGRQDSQGGDGRSREGDDEEGGSNRRRRRNRQKRRNKGQGGDQPGGGPQGQPQQQELGEVRGGVLDILPEGYGFLRAEGLLPGDKDAYVSQGMIKKAGLRRGDVVSGPTRPQKNQEKVPAIAHIEDVNGQPLDDQGRVGHRPDFKDMTPLFPTERLPLETPDGPISMRIVDLMSPIGKGQRGLIVSPPKAGKTTILKELGQAISYNNPECHVMVVLVDERPEEVTDMRRSVPGEIIASTFDRPADDHTQIAELSMERAKRLVEAGQDVVVLLDSITRLARAYNLAAPASGRIMSGGVDSTALYPPKRFFGAARNIEGGGSLTIIASALIETGSKMDEVIFEEFKGTGNMELRLDRRLEQKRIFPAIDIEGSGTRKEELLLDREELEIIWKLRRVLHALEGPSALELLIDKMKQTRSNNQFLVQIQKSNLQT
ncbi:transcription termination factor Rho [Egibacter rhizosphaerae]|uniref:Transcription termination factor Rho n=1 Tax=Egibacter rhizosphaerae TaxID=1670831 RepID=A0A411YD64_9ACTN|nr:transcription termination factor Rho [Egibacter rhizosphaerae]QBI19128.1 transcription termination factor Rho [Egibacter rhizosphaerae]